MNWKEDSEVENLLKSLGVEYKIVKVKMNDVDWEKSLQNHARIGKPVDDEVVEEYALAMRRGDSFPMTLLRHVPNKKCIVMGGNHRLRGSRKNGEEEFPCYLIYITDQFLIDLIPRILHRRFGLRVSREEALQHAAYLVTTYNMSQKMACEHFNLAEGAIGEEITARNVAAELSKIGITSLGRGHLLKLRPIQEYNETVFYAVARLCKDAKMTIEQLGNFLKELKKKARNEGASIALIEEYRKKLGADVPLPYASQKKQPRSVFLSVLTQMERKMKEPNTLQKWQITDLEHQKEVIRRLYELIKETRSFVQRSQNRTEKSDPAVNGRRRMAQVH